MNRGGCGAEAGNEVCWECAWVVEVVVWWSEGGEVEWIGEGAWGSSAHEEDTDYRTGGRVGRWSCGRQRAGSKAAA